jgi:hypothetical protein
MCWSADARSPIARRSVTSMATFRFMTALVVGRVGENQTHRGRLELGHFHQAVSVPDFPVIAMIDRFGSARLRAMLESFGLTFRPLDNECLSASGVRCHSRLGLSLQVVFGLDQTPARHGQLLARVPRIPVAWRARQSAVSRPFTPELAARPPHGPQPQAVFVP